MGSMIDSQLPSLFDLNPLKSITIPNTERIEPKGLTLIIGPNSAGKTQLLRDIYSRLCGKPRKLVVCKDVEINHQSDFTSVLNVLESEGHIRRSTDAHNNVIVKAIIPAFGESSQAWSLSETTAKLYFEKPVSIGKAPQDSASDKFLEHFGRSFVTALFLERRLTVTKTVNSFDYENQPPTNELQALYIDSSAKQLLAQEARTVFGKAVWLDNTRGQHLCLRTSDEPEMPSPEKRLDPAKMRDYRLIEDEGDGFKSYIAICITLLLGRRPVVLIDEPEMCLHPPQAYALGRFIGKYGSQSARKTFVATHSSHVLKGIIEETEQLEVIRLSRMQSQFAGHRISQETLKESVKTPSTKSENVLNGLFSEAVTIVESEGDRLLYNAAWEKVNSKFSHDMYFVSVSGIGGIAAPCALYRNLEIPVCIAADLDAIREVSTFENILKAVAPEKDARELMVSCQNILAEVKALGPIYSESYAHHLLKEVLDNKFDWKNTEQLNSIRNALSKLSRGLSQTSRLKQGLGSFENSSVEHNLSAFVNRCKRYGLFLVPVGELEDWVPHLVQDGPSRKKKAEWANYAANQIRESPSQEGDVWEFVKSMAFFQEHESSRLMGYSVK